MQQNMSWNNTIPVGSEILKGKTEYNSMPQNNTQAT